MIFDTDVLIWHIRRNINASNLLLSAQKREISQATWLELVRGVRNKRELVEARAMLAGFGFRVLPLTESIGNKAGDLMEEYALSDGLDSMDSIIAATALIHDLPLATANYRHYKATGVRLVLLKP
jgi:predicted nucleic acid-binding protein